MAQKIKPPSRVVDGRVEEIKATCIAATRPDLLLIWNREQNQARGLDPFEVTEKDDRYAVWVCQECGSPWEQAIDGRVKSSTLLCPTCGHYRTIGSRRTIRDTAPVLWSEFIRERNADDPEKVYVGQRQPSYWWKCHQCGYEWKETVRSRMEDRNEDGDFVTKPCPCCEWKGKRKTFKNAYPETARIYSRVNERHIDELMETYSRVCFWDCPYCGRTFESETRTVLKNLSAGKLQQMCPHNGFILGPYGTIFNEFPILEIEWAPENVLLKMDPMRISSDYDQLAIWVCPDCNLHYPMPVSKRVSYIMREMGNPCPYCNGRRIKMGHFF